MGGDSDTDKRVTFNEPEWWLEDLGGSENMIEMKEIGNEREIVTEI